MSPFQKKKVIEDYSAKKKKCKILKSLWFEGNQRVFHVKHPQWSNHFEVAWLNTSNGVLNLNILLFLHSRYLSRRWSFYLFSLNHLFASFCLMLLSYCYFYSSPFIYLLSLYFLALTSYSFLKKDIFFIIFFIHN